MENHRENARNPTVRESYTDLPWFTTE